MKLIISILVLFTGFSVYAEENKTAFAEENRTCFRESSIRRWRAIDSNTLDVWGRRGVRYRVDTWSCWEMKWANRIAFRGFGGFDRICRGDDVLVLDDFSNKVIDRCRIRRITRIQ